MPGHLRAACTTPRCLLTPEQFGELHRPASFSFPINCPHRHFERWFSISNPRAFRLKHQHPLKKPHNWILTVRRVVYDFRPVTSSSRSVIAVDCTLVLRAHIFRPNQSSSARISLCLLREGQLASGLDHEHSVGQHIHNLSAECRHKLEFVVPGPCAPSPDVEFWLSRFCKLFDGLSAPKRAVKLELALEAREFFT